MKILLVPCCFSEVPFGQLMYKLFIALLSLAQLAQAEELILEVVDEFGKPLPARVRVRDETGTDYFPADAIKIPLGNDHWFVTPGSSRLNIPSGKFEVRVEHGLEYQPEKQTIRCKTGQTTRQVIKPTRWINLRDLGYVCGENHLHVPAEELGPLLVAEGLDFGTSMQWWNARRFEVATLGGPLRSLKYAGKTVPTSIYDYEIEHDWGAVYVIGQPTPLADDDEPDRPNLPIIRRSHDAGALVCYQGGWSREVLLDAVLGHVDVVNVCNNNFLRHAYQPRSRYSNLLQISGFPTYANTVQEMLKMNTDTYYRLLNCGLRLAAGAGSATGAKRTPVGYNRAYVRVDRDPTWKEFLENWRQGRNFVTNGPMVFLKVNRRFLPGDTIPMETTGEMLRVEVSASFPHPLSSLEIVLNGRVVHHISDAKSGSVSILPIKIEESSWLAARCCAEDTLLSNAELSAYAWGSDQMPRRPTRVRFAHTSPIYISLNGTKARVDQSVREAHQILDAIADFASDKTAQPIRAEILRATIEAHKKIGRE